MAAVKELIRGQQDGSVSFGDHTLAEKAKLDNFVNSGDVYKVKTYSALTKLEKNGMFLYESVPGTSIENFSEQENGVSFNVSGNEDAQITLGMKDDTEYEVFVGGSSVGKMSTGLGGKLSVSVELAGMGEVAIKVVEA
ncbi:MAG: endosialidase [Lachnospiraceae bacterium]|nr:endosialidase [Lachnospiraceae bacterium]